MHFEVGGGCWRFCKPFRTVLYFSKVRRETQITEVINKPAATDPRGGGHPHSPASPVVSLRAVMSGVTCHLSSGHHCSPVMREVGQGRCPGPAPHQPAPHNVPALLARSTWHFCPHHLAVPGYSLRVACGPQLSLLRALRWCHPVVTAHLGRGHSRPASACAPVPESPCVAAPGHTSLS